MRKSTFAGALLALCLSVCALAGEPPAQVDIDVSGWLSLDAQGAVEKVELGEQVPVPVADLVKRSARTWRFEPVLKDGKPAPSRTYLQLHLVGEPREGGYGLRVKRAQFGWSRDIVKPGRAGQQLDRLNWEYGTEVLLAVQVDAAGKVLAVAPLRSRLVPATGGPKGRKLRASFERNAVSGMENATFAPGDGPTVVILNVIFGGVERVGVASMWTKEDTAVTSTGTPAWLSGKVYDGGLSDLGGQAVALDGGPTPRTQIEGTLL